MLELHKISPGIIYKITEIFLEQADWKIALDQASKLLQSVFVFDHLVVYVSTEDKCLDVQYAKAKGRGKAAEADINWGETIANLILENPKIIVDKPVGENLETNRLKQPHLLGIPMTIHGNLLGVMIAIRFGGPDFKESEIDFMENTAHLTALSLEMAREHEKVQKQAQQVQLKEDFISTISHELRSPLGFIKGYTTTLLRSDTTWDYLTQHEFLQIIEQEADYLQELIENLLDSARLQSGQLNMNFQPVRLDAVINDVITRMHVRYANQVIQVKQPKILPTIIGDPRRLGQVIENLVSNAAKYAPEFPVSITIKKEAIGINLVISDSGPGIPEKYLPFVFERFFRNPDQSPLVHGSGLGLFICKEIIQAHSGTIEASSTVGKGTEFRIFLPYQNFEEGV